MKVLLINGSPNKKGSTFTALSHMSEVFKSEGVESEIYHIGKEPVAPCRACYSCAKLQKCIIEDKVNEFLEFAMGFDGYVIGSPVHYAGASGGVVPFLHRVFLVNHMGARNCFEHKPATAIVSARRAGATTTIDQLNKYFQITQMPVVSGRYWNMVHGNSPDEVVKDLEGMQNLRFLARNFAYLLKCKEAAKNAGILPPEQEEVIYTNFIRDGI
ncbi:NADPH-dependent FMN reductase [Helicobacter sp. 16-1353]|uniref:flavodoxin family protein n=1 Tax=Helicobacter sp. 16-1353 TaxID=2004996 RepID=UPI000DCC637B|nr:flavodoxin family protein [Helicobacter sp. 16-1353]RAX54474.1 NADPH-dependent FMN reductase [Helicobacter sp. 16-1353]